MGSVRCSAGSQKSSSRARWTSVPLVAGGDGGSGSRSMAENRNASAQSLNDATFEGESELGSGRAITGEDTAGV